MSVVVMVMTMAVAAVAMAVAAAVLAALEADLPTSNIKVILMTYLKQTFLVWVQYW